jgi:hypothetical protein
MNDDAGFMLLSEIKKEIPHLPLLLLSSEPKNRERAKHIPADFLDKNAPDLKRKLHHFFLNCLGFGDFIFRTPDGKEIARASNLKGLEEILADIPDEPLCYQAHRNRFSNWIMARSEIGLAARMSKIKISDFPDVKHMRRYIINSIHALRKWRQKGVVAQFMPDDFDPEVSDFVKIGNGSLGGKARGLSFMANLLQQTPDFHEKFPAINIIIPKTLIITTEGFESFVTQNKLQHLADGEHTNDEVLKHFLDADMPEWLQKKLKAFLAHVTYPLSIRSSSLWEDLQFQPYAGLYKTYMIPNNHSDFSKRFHQLITAVKLVYASTYFEEPRKFSSSVAHQFQKDSMAVMIQQAAGKEYGTYFYPAISGIAQSRNFYPLAYMQPEEGVARIVLGMGKAIPEGSALRFSPKHPNFLPQFSKVKDILSNSQRFFYALKIRNYPDILNTQADTNLEKRELAEAEMEFPVKALSSTYFPEEDRIRDSGNGAGFKVLTFASVLKYDIFPLPQVLSDLLDLGRKSMGCPVEFEFSVDLRLNEKSKSNFFILQIRPMAAGDEHFNLQIGIDDINRAFCYSTQSLGHGQIEEITDIIYVKPDNFDPSATIQIAKEISRLNAMLLESKQPYLLVGFGRWGSDDRWLGIPVKWSDISGVKVMIELRNAKLRADPSQGSHFFQKITSLGVHYLTITEGTSDFFNWNWIYTLPIHQETTFLRHVKLTKPFVLKNDGRKSQCVLFET